MSEKWPERLFDFGVGFDKVADMNKVLEHVRAGLLVAMLGIVVLAGCERAPDDVREARNRHLRRALAAKQSQDIDGAIAWCQRALERRPNLALAHRELALMLDNYREDYVGAIYHYRRYLELRPDSSHREAVEELIRHCRVSLASQVGDMPAEWQRDLQVRNARIRVLETELAMWRAGGGAPEATAPPPRAEVPPPVATPPPVAGDVQTHVVRSGETLGTISSRYYGTPAKWNRIFEANRERISNANNVRVGTTLVIPRD
jgi:tetratricopeptide (TPR) repeat protein